MDSEVILEWLEKEQFWDDRSSLVVSSHGLLCFRTVLFEGRTFASPLNTGAPNTYINRWVGPRQTGLRLGIHNSSGQALVPDHYYVAKEFSIMNEVLFLPKPSPSCALVRLRKSTDESRTVMEIFAGIGSWSFVALSLISEILERPYEIIKPVDNSEMAAKTYQKNHTTPVEVRDVGNKSAWPYVSPFMVCGSPPCPLFSSLSGSGGFAARSVRTRAWCQMVSMLRCTQPEVSRLMYLSGFKMVHYRIVNVASHAPFHRPRWGFVWNRIANPTELSPMIAQWTPSPKPHSLETFECVLDKVLDTPEQNFSPRQVEMLQKPSPFQALGRLQDCACRRRADDYSHAWQVLRAGRRYAAEVWFVVPLPRSGRFRSHVWRMGGCERSSGMVLPSDPRAALSLLGNSVSPLQCGVGILMLELCLGNVDLQKSGEIVELFASRAQSLRNVERCVEGSWQRLVPKPNRPDAPSEALDHHSPDHPSPLVKPSMHLGNSPVFPVFPEASPEKKQPRPASVRTDPSGLNSQDSARCHGQDALEGLESDTEKDCKCSQSSTSPMIPRVSDISPVPLDDALFQRMDDSNKFHEESFPGQEMKSTQAITVHSQTSCDTHSSGPINPLDVSRTLDLALQNPHMLGGLVDQKSTTQGVMSHSMGKEYPETIQGSDLPSAARVGPASEAGSFRQHFAFRLRIPWRKRKLLWRKKVRRRRKRRHVASS